MIKIEINKEALKNLTKVVNKMPGQNGGISIIKGSIKLINLNKEEN